MNIETKQPLIVLTGPTAVGKSTLSIALAHQIGGEIISGDSMQVYRHMDIGTDKINQAKMEGIPHYLIDILEPTQSFDVEQFQYLANEAIQTIRSHGHIPILVGGTGFYLQAVTRQISFTETNTDEAYRAELWKQAKTEGVRALHDSLRSVDPAAASQIHANNVKRVIRALEFYRQTGQRISEHNACERAKKSPFNLLYLVLDVSRDQLYARIEQRIDQMVEDGLVDEVKHLLSLGCTEDMVSMKGLGYKEILAYLEGACTLDKAINTLKRNTRHFAKRQLTWFKREDDAVWINKEEYSDDQAAILQRITDLCREREII